MRRCAVPTPATAIPTTTTAAIPTAPAAAAAATIRCAARSQLACVARHHGTRITHQLAVLHKVGHGAQVARCGAAQRDERAVDGAGVAHRVRQPRNVGGALQHAAHHGCVGGGVQHHRQTLQHGLRQQRKHVAVSAGGGHGGGGRAHTGVGGHCALPPQHACPVRAHRGSQRALQAVAAVIRVTHAGAAAAPTATAAAATTARTARGAAIYTRRRCWCWWVNVAGVDAVSAVCCWRRKSIGAPLLAAWRSPPIASIAPAAAAAAATGVGCRPEVCHVGAQDDLRRRNGVVDVVQVLARQVGAAVDAAVVGHKLLQRHLLLHHLVVQVGVQHDDGV